MLSPKVPAVVRILTMVTKLRSLSHHLPDGAAPPADKFDPLIRAAAKAMRVPQEGLRNSLLAYFGHPFREKEWNACAWRFAGNLARLKAGETITGWTSQPFEEWTTIQFTSCHTVPGENRRFEVSYRVLSGLPAGLFAKTRMSGKQIFFLGSRAGFRRRDPLQSMSRPSELVNLRLLALLDPALSARFNQPTFTQLATAPGVLEHNRKIILMRARIGFDCPHGFEHQCCRCPVGLDGCPAATHAATYEQRDCLKCQTTGLYDPAPGGIGCFTCHSRKGR
jgi:hypothetical protein